MKLRRFSGLPLRNLRARVQRTLLTTIGIVLGVGIVFGVLTLSETMSGAFSNLFSRAFGAADLTVTAAGGNGSFDEEVVEKVRELPEVESAAPRLSQPASLLLSELDENGLPQVKNLRLLGVDPETAALATDFELAEGRYPEEGAEVSLDEGAADEAGLGVGETVRIGTPEGPAEMEVVGLLRIPGSSFGGLAFGLAPLPYAQEVFDEPGRITGIAVEATNDLAVDGLQESLTGVLGEGLQAERSETRTGQASAQLQSFQIALLFFAGTALFVGAFLVFNALSMTVLERTRELGMLRALGATRAMIARSVMFEALVLGLAGSALGTLLGYAMAEGLVYLFGRAYRFEITELILSPFALVSAMIVGILITAVAALYPALQAGRVSPVEAMRARIGGVGVNQAKKSKGSRRLTISGLLLIAAGAPWTYYLAKNLSASLDGLVYASGIAGVVGTFLGVSLVIPALVRPLAALFSPVLRLFFGVEGKMAAANATRNRGRTALTASALMVGISLVVAFSALGGSVLGSIRDYLEGSLGSDFVVQPANGNFEAAFSPELEEEISQISGVEETSGVASTFRRSGDEVNAVFGVDERYPEIFRLNYAEGTPPDAFSELERGGALIGPQLAGKRGLAVGSTFELPGLEGTKEYTVAGVVQNDLFGFGNGVYLSKDTLASDFGEDSDSFLAIETASGSDRAEIEEEVRGTLQDYPQLMIYSNAAWKERIEEDFDRQYVFFYAIMGVSVAVSAFGVVNTLSMSVFERTREIGILRAIGTTRLQVGRLIICEGMIISLIGCIIGTIVGSLLGYLFVRGSGANGFEVSFYYPTVPALLSIFSGLLIGVFAGLLPARSAASTKIVEAVQYE
ncbi:MAG: ABC transporter, fused permease protein [uncultured Rubrobacteraceae bacterium]|uniref:ABC transporter, fused permease protein n=1 Tax=uncultured Rubrobacteraceae bacterium TaxID=349277 RepID=A0A6J4QV91_9ACTN|nr:MAG: ABC transporter, fused permease protein [uncultured Rubrobacteraceae bacterium]